MGPLRLPRYRSVDYYDVWKLHNEGLNAVFAHAENGPLNQDFWQTEAVYLESDGVGLSSVSLERGL